MTETLHLTEAAARPCPACQGGALWIVQEAGQWLAVCHLCGLELEVIRRVDGYAAVEPQEPPKWRPQAHWSRR